MIHPAPDVVPASCDVAGTDPSAAARLCLHIFNGTSGLAPHMALLATQGCSTLRRLRVVSPWGNRCSENGVGGGAAGFPALRKSDP